MKKDYIVRQNDISDCGICCLLSIIKYYKGYIPLEKLRLDTKTNQNGTTAYNLIETAKKYGFNAQGKKIDELDENIVLPAIAHLAYENGLNHFVVIYQINDRFVYLMDPAKGYERININEFKKLWTNIILIFKPYRKLPFYKYHNSLSKLFILIFKDEYKFIVKIFILDILLIISSIILSYYFQIASHFSVNGTYFKVIILLLFYLSIYIFKIYANYVKNDIAICLNKNIDLKLVPSFINHVFKLPLNIIKGRTSGELITRIREIYNLKELITEIIISVCFDLILFISLVIFLYQINGLMFMLLLIITVIYLLVGIFSAPYIYQKVNDNIDLETFFNSAVCEKVAEIESIKNLNYTSNTCNYLEDLFVNYLSNTFEYANSFNKISFIKDLVKEIGLFIVIGYGFLQLNKGLVSFTSLVTFNFMMTLFFNPIENIVNSIPKFLLIKLSLVKLNEFLNVSDEKEGEIGDFYNGDIRFMNINYSYDDYQNIFSNYNLIIRKNDHFTIKGRSGSGKSTLCKFLNRSIEDYKGNIFIDGINIKDYSLKTIRNNIVYVSQNEHLFTDTIRNNILLDKEIDIKELYNILHLTKVDEILSKKSFKLDSMLMEGGFNLSGGERQRIILARALVRKPKILILDESLSEVDQELEKNIISNLDKYLENVTLIYISHNENNYLKKVLEFNLT